MSGFTFGASINDAGDDAKDDEKQFALNYVLPLGSGDMMSGDHTIKFGYGHSSADKAEDGVEAIFDDKGKLSLTKDDEANTGRSDKTYTEYGVE